MIDDTVERIRSKNHRLMDELRGMIQDNKLTPIDMNVEKVNKSERIDDSRIPRLSPRKGTVSSKGTPLNGDSSSAKGDSSPVKEVPVRQMPVKERTVRETPIAPLKTPIESPTKESRPKEKKTFESKKPSISSGSIPPKSVKFPSYTPVEPSNLLLQKIHNQDNEIESLRALVKQLKHENNLLKQDNYQYQSNNNKLIKQSNRDIETLKESYEKDLKQKDLQTNELKKEVDNCNLLINQYRLMDRNKDNKIIALKEIITSIQVQINDKNIIINNNHFQIEDLKIYNKLVKRLIQSVIEKFNQNLDKISEIIDSNQAFDERELGDFNSPHILKSPQIFNLNYDQDDTSDLLYNNTTKQLIKNSFGPSLDKLFLNNELVKTPLVKFRIAAKLVLFLVKLNKSRRH